MHGIKKNNQKLIQNHKTVHVLSHVDYTAHRRGDKRLNHKC